MQPQTEMTRAERECRRFMDLAMHHLGVMQDFKLAAEESREAGKDNLALAYDNAVKTRLECVAEAEVHMCLCFAHWWGIDTTTYEAHEIMHLLNFCRLPEGINPDHVLRTMI